jgi:HPt (histidine-containing phosphotransfer) domain-containing protein
MQSMRKSLDEGNWDSLRIESHGIKGGSWNLEARRLGDEAAGLEAAAKERNRDAAERYLHSVGLAFAEFQQRVGELPQFKAAS